MTIGFGKYKGSPLDEVPLSYLVWLIENTTIRDEKLIEHIVDRVRAYHV